MNFKQRTICAAALVLSPPLYAQSMDFGTMVESQLHNTSEALFGFGTPLKDSATDVIERVPGQAASERQLLAEGLTAQYVTRAVGGNGDMISFWPDDVNYTHLMVCNELGRADLADTAFGSYEGQNPAVQSVNVTTGEVSTILYGMARCDGIRTTQWGTVLATEETSDGAAYEIIDPLNTHGHWIADRGEAGIDADIRTSIGGEVSSDTIVKRTALVTQAWEGLEVLDNGVVIGGDELRAGNGDGFDSDGGAIFRFVPSSLYFCGERVRPGLLCPNLIHDLSQSPLAAGQNYALATACTGNDDVGQGCEYGEGKWVEVGAATARADANLKGATGYCRPEDLHIDRESPRFKGGDGILWCWANTCGGGAGEALCVVESDAVVDATSVVFDEDFGNNLLASDDGSEAQVEVTRFVEGDDEMNSHDNLEIQPVTRNVYIIEDNDFGDIWACLPDGADRDKATDGCVRMLSINSTAAEPSGFIFDGTGEVAYYHVQHGQQIEGLLDFASNPVDGRTDDLIKISGFKTALNGAPANVNSPTALTGLVYSSSAVEIFWDRAVPSDNAITGYNIYRNGELVETRDASSYFDDELIANTGYKYEVVAVDSEGNTSEKVSVSLTTNLR